jgi:hypothetical protein
MSWTVNDREFAAVSALDAPGRYEYFIHKVAAWEEVWGLAAEDGWVQLGDGQGHECMAVWPHPRYAEAFAQAQPGGEEPRQIELSAWMEKWLPGMERDGHLVAVFPVPTGNAVVVPPARLRDDLEEELENYDWSQWPVGEELIEGECGGPPGQE